MRVLGIFYLLIFVLPVPLKAQDWTLIDTNVTHTGAALNAAFFTDDTTGYIVGETAFGGVILKTTNAGAAWNLQTVTYPLLNVYFPSKDTGYAVGRHSTIMKTINAGTSWTYQNSGISTLYWASAVCFLDNNTGFVSVKNGPGYAFLKTQNGGQTWINDISDTVHMDFFSKINDSTIYGIYGRFSKTNNKGNSWSNKEIPSGWASGISFLDANTGFATLDHANGDPCSNYSSLIKTTDAGQNWVETNYNCDFLYSIIFPSSSTGYMLGNVTIGGDRKIWKTIDGGTNWYQSTYPVGTPYDSTSAYGISIVCTNPTTCYILTNYGTIIKTTSGGGAIGINEQNGIDKDFKIYPNPANDYITLEFKLSEIKNLKIEIKNILGQSLLTKDLQPSEEKATIDISNLPSGIYLIELRTARERFSRKFIKQ